MISHQFASERGPLVVRRYGSGYTEDLEAWLDIGAQPSTVAGVAAGGDTARWHTPACAVDLVYDTAVQRLPSGVRAVMREGSRRLLFETQAYEIMLRVASHRLTERYELLGQVLFDGLPLSGVVVELDVDGPRIAPGRYGLRLAVTGAVLIVPPITVP